MSHIRLDEQKPEEALSYLAAFLVAGGEVSPGRTPKVTITLRHSQSVLLAEACLDLLYRYRPEITLSAHDKRKTHLFDLELPQSVSARLLDDCRMRKQTANGYTYSLGTGSMRWVKAGCYCCALYLECGRLYGGEDYRLDLVIPPSERRRAELEDRLAKLEVRYNVLPQEDKFRFSIRRESVATFLAFIGASQAALAVTEYYFERNVNRAVTRSINCSTNNMDKAYKAATNQLWAIGVLKDKGVYNLLPREVRQVGDARLANAQATLQQIADEMGLNKTAVYRRMKAITDAAEKYKGE